MDFTHFNDSGEAVMVDVSDKEIRRAMCSYFY